MSFEDKLNLLLRARFTLVFIVTCEEQRAIASIKKVCEQRQRPCLSWDVAEYFRAVTNWDGAPPVAQDPKTALEFVEKCEKDAVFVFKDFHEVWKSGPVIKRKLKNVVQQLQFTRKSLIITSPTCQIPDELRDEAVVIEYDLPGVVEIESELNKLTQTPDVKTNLTRASKTRLCQAALGLTASQAKRAFSKAIVASGGLDERNIELITEEKKAVIRESKALEFYSVSETPDDAGGLDVLKEWLKLRDRAFTEAAHDYGLPAPKGIALIGIPGTGKSLSAKIIGGLWRLPLLRLDIGSLFGSLVGESEERTRKALNLAETVAPCILWIDEVEKAFGQNANDGGTSTRVFGTILTWMQEKTAPCFVVATANNIAALPPELMRKGRFDEIFFLDLPTTDERKEIFSVHLRKRKRLAQDYDIDRLARESKGYVGAEIEQAIVDAMYFGFDEDREFTTEDVSKALRRQVPLSVSQKENIDNLRMWLKEGRAASASREEKSTAERDYTPLEVL